MAAKHELEIEIGPTGDVQVHVKGAKGKQCLNYVELFSQMGQVKDQQLTGEFYEPEGKVGIIDQMKTRFGR